MRVWICELIPRAGNSFRILYLNRYGQKAKNGLQKEETSPRKDRFRTPCIQHIYNKESIPLFSMKLKVLLMAWSVTRLQNCMHF